MSLIIKTLLAAGLFAAFNLHAMAADTAPAATPPLQERFERMKTMTPEQRLQERDAMHKEM